jgi:transcriptional regulator with XRE-family HTH domain
MSQEALAAATGVSGATISHIESGKMRRPERDTLEALAAALGVSYNDLAYAAGYADPPAERDVESEMRRIATLPTTEERMSELKRSLPLVYEYVEGMGTRSGASSRRTRYGKRSGKRRQTHRRVIETSQETGIRRSEHGDRINDRR